jgi:hypothetical protein
MIPPQLIMAGIQLATPLINKLINGGQQNANPAKIDINTQANLQSMQPQMPGQEVQTGMQPATQQMPLQTTQATPMAMEQPITQSTPLTTEQPTTQATPMINSPQPTMQPNQQGNMLNTSMGALSSLLPLLLKNKQPGVI